MASLKQVIRDNRFEITNTVAWVAIYKDGRSWMAEAFYPKDGDYENGYVLDEYDYGRMKEIVDTDHKAICINGDYMGGLEDFTLDELENKILWFYERRLHQLQGDFLECMVVPPKTYDLYENKGLSAVQLREEYRGLTGLDNDQEFTDEEIYKYMLDALWEKGDPSVDELISAAAQRSHEGAKGQEPVGRDCIDL